MRIKHHFDEQECLKELKHYLPAQAPLKDFIHHNTLHAFQDLKFHNAMQQASEMFGFKVYLQLEEYRALYKQSRISDDAIRTAIKSKQLDEGLWTNNLLNKNYNTNLHARVGKLRALWGDAYKINLDKFTHPTIFRLLNNYLDQGIAMHQFPVHPKGFLASVRELQKQSYISLFKSERARLLFEHSEIDMSYLLEILVGDESLYEHYLFDQQFAHPGWSGMVAVLEDQPSTLYDARKISLKELIQFELLLEIDGLDTKFGESWQPLSSVIDTAPDALFKKADYSELSEVLAMWQEAFEWTYYNEVLNGLDNRRKQSLNKKAVSFHALFCIDDRECSFRRHVEQIDPQADTYGTPGFFNVEFYFQPENGKFHTKVCPAPVQPKHLIREADSGIKQESEMHFTKHTHSLISGWLISQTLGFWSALKLLANIFKPGVSPATSYSFRHMDKQGKLSIEHQHGSESVDGLQVGFTIEEMANRVEGLLKSIGLFNIGDTLVYAVGHGASSINNTHYAGYDCGACSGRPGSVNARVISYMGNHSEVRRILRERGLNIHDNARFIGALHDTTRDEIEFYDIDQLNEAQKQVHAINAKNFNKALDNNAKERSRRFILMNTKREAAKVHEKVKLRSVSLFEPRPELNHATNTLCIVGGRHLSYGLFLDRRAFLNSYDPFSDPEGKYLLPILNAVAPVCGGINLEYYFSKTDNYKLGAGTKLPHNVMGLIGVANGTDGDLRTGLPWQMVEVHDPMRLLCIVEHYPDTILSVLSRNAATEQWFLNDWIHLVAIHPESGEMYRYIDKTFGPLQIHQHKTQSTSDIMAILEENDSNLPVYLIQEEHDITA